MFEQIVFRMVIGGIVVSGFALLSDILKPKRFAGLFGAAPSVALATLALAAGTKGKLYAANEAHSMIAGAVALVVYVYCIPAAAKATPPNPRKPAISATTRKTSA
jgi:hypothetical protein